MSAHRPPAELTGPTVVIRRYTTADAAQLHEAISDSVEHLTPWMPWAALEPLELADREHLIEDWHQRWERGEDFNLGVFEGDQLVGSCGLHRRIGPVGLEIGYWTRVDNTRRGIATEVAGCLVEAAFSMPDIELVEIHHDAANLLSGRIPERLGFRLVERRADEPTAPGEIGTECIWRLTRRDRPELGGS